MFLPNFHLLNLLFFVILPWALLYDSLVFRFFLYLCLSIPEIISILLLILRLNVKIFDFKPLRYFSLSKDFPNMINCFIDVDIIFSFLTIEHWNLLTFTNDPYSTNRAQPEFHLMLSSKSLSSLRLLWVYLLTL